jgi:hypothetical protein
VSNCQETLRHRSFSLHRASLDRQVPIDETEKKTHSTFWYFCEYLRIESDIETDDRELPAATPASMAAGSAAPLLQPKRKRSRVALPVLSGIFFI